VRDVHTITVRMSFLLSSFLLSSLILFSSLFLTPLLFYSYYLLIPYTSDGIPTLLQFGATSIHVAASKGHVIPLKLLLDRGAELEACDSVRCSYAV
jgi:hypothetical protein